MFLCTGARSQLNEGFRHFSQSEVQLNQYEDLVIEITLTQIIILYKGFIKFQKLNLKTRAIEHILYGNYSKY